MFIDWIDMYQDFDVSLKQLSDIKNIIVDTTTGETLRETQPTYKFQGSHSTLLHIRIADGRLSVSGNPSRINRPDNLFGYRTIESAVRCYNSILSSLGLPTFTKSTGLKYLQSKNDHYTVFSDGAVFTRIDVTSNISVGQDNESDYIKGVSTLAYRHLVPNLYTDGYTVDWLNHKNKASTLIYAKLYNKAKAIEKFDIFKVKNKFGEKSPEYKYITELHDYCINHGVVRFEQEFKALFFRQNPHFRYYGLSELHDFEALHSEFLNITNKLQVTAMSLESIAERLLRLGICTTTLSANTTAMYAVQWMAGKQFDFNKRAVQTHRARLRKIGVDLYHKCDLSRHSSVYIKQAREVTESSLIVPDWYVNPVNHLKLVA